MSPVVAFKPKAKPVEKKPLDTAAIAFQPDSVEIEERPFPRSARSVVYVVAGLIVTAALWATFAQVDRVVVARGKLITVDPLIVVQPLETGVIRTIDVGVGQYVKAGTVLATLDPTFTESQEIANRERLSSMQAEAARLQAEIYGQPFPPAKADTFDPKYLALQTAIYTHRKAEYQAAVAAAEADVSRLTAALSTNQNGQQGLEERLKVITQVESMRQELLNLEAGSRLNLLTTKLDRLSLSDQLSEKKYQEKELMHQLAAARETRERYINNWVREAGERLTTVQQDMATAAQQLASSTRRQALVVLRAPSDGVVLELGQRSIGSVAKEAEPLITLVPQDNKIEAEVDVDSSDVARLRVNDPVRVKFDALPYQRHGTMDGTVRVITENSFQSDRNNQPPTNKPDGNPSFFRARIALGPVNLRNVPADFHLIPGMTTSAEIVIGKRRVISYLLDPIVRLFDESLREP